MDINNDKRFNSPDQVINTIHPVINFNIYTIRMSNLYSNL